MLTWKYSVSIAVVYLTVASFIVDIKQYFKPKDSKYIQLDCFDPSGDSSVMCYFANKFNRKWLFNITRIHARGNITTESIKLMTNIGFHKYNMPEHMPENIGVIFPKIEELYITHSSLMYLHRFSFKCMENLQILDLDNNEIKSIPDDAFNDLHNLVFLKLNGNKIKTLQPPLLNHLRKLHTFSAVKNKITRIDKYLFRFNHKIKWIYLFGNKIEKIEVDFRRLRHLKAVDLRQNPNHCNLLFNAKFKTNLWVENFQKSVKKFCNA